MTLEEVVSRMSGPDGLYIETEDKEAIYNGLHNRYSIRRFGTLHLSENRKKNG